MKTEAKDLEIFSNKQLWAMILPLLAEQLLIVVTGIANSLIVSFVGEAAVSGVTLVNQINLVFTLIFVALGAGGGVVISQYIGHKRIDKACLTASQMLILVVCVSVFLGILMLIVNKPFLVFLFGSVEADVMNSAELYLSISCIGYPFMGIYCAGCAIFRCLGKTSTTMIVALVACILNIVSGFACVAFLNWGVAGVAIPTVICQFFQAAWITLLCCRKSNFIRYKLQYFKILNKNIIKKILHIALPNAVEAGSFQLVKVLLSSIVALFGTYQIAANGIAQTWWTLAASIGLAMGPVFITVIGRAMGDQNIEAAEYNFKRLLKITFFLSLGWNILIPILVLIVMPLYPIDAQTKELTLILILIHNIFNTIAFPFSSSLGNGLRATGDVKFTLFAAIISTIIVRVIASWILAVAFDMGVIGVAWAMAIDWVVRGIMQIIRLKSGKWKQFKVI